MSTSPPMALFGAPRKHTDDGLGEGEDAFLVADNLFLQGKRDQARALFERVLSLTNDVGLLSEE